MSIFNSLAKALSFKESYAEGSLIAKLISGEVIPINISDTEIRLFNITSRHSFLITKDGFEKGFAVLHNLIASSQELKTMTELGVSDLYLNKQERIKALHSAIQTIQKEIISLK